MSFLRKQESRKISRDPSFRWDDTITMVAFIVSIITIIFTSSVNAADPQPAIAMHGETQMLAEDFSVLPYANPSVTQGGTLTQCAIGSFDTLNDNTMKGKPAEGLHMLNDPLMRRVWSEPFSLYGVIAKDVILPDDRSSVTFILNPNAIFHDGSKITVEDVKFSFQTLREKGKPNTRNVYKLVKDVMIESPHRIRFDFGEGHDRETALILAMMPIYSKAYWGTREFDATTLEAPLGNGPYKIKQVEEGKKITYEKVLDYWAKDLPIHTGHYNFDYMVFDYFRDEQVALEAFKAGDCDLRREGNPAKWQVNYQEGEGYRMEALDHARPEPARGFIMNTRRAPLHDLKVRRALTLAFDFDWMNTALFHGKAKQITSTFANTNLSGGFSLPTGSKRERLKQADDLLTQAGWPLQDGQRFALSLILNNPAEEKIALAYARDLKRLGVTLNIRTLDTAQFFGALNDYDYDLVSWRWINSLSPGSEQMIYWGCAAADTKGSRNYSRICHPEIDLAAQALAEASDYKTLTKRAQTLDSMIMNQYLFIPHYYMGQDFVAYHPPLRHPADQSLYGIVLETWWKEYK